MQHDKRPGQSAAEVLITKQHDDKKIERNEMKRNKKKKR